MKIPLAPPALDVLMKKLLNTKAQSKSITNKLLSYAALTPKYKAYIHWDKLRHLTPPEGWSIEEVWLAIKFARSHLYRSLPFIDKHKRPFHFAMPDSVLAQLYTIDRHFGHTIQNTAAMFNNDWRDTYLVSSLIEEAITSSQLEGASTTRKIAKEMLQTHRKPCDISEQMIANNYKAMQFIRETKDEVLTVEMILELHHVLTDKTLPETECGRFRTSKDDIHIWDDRDATVLHTPPEAKTLAMRLKRICDFANTQDEKHFIHPIIKAIILHFMLAYDHPFTDGNGRTARALFYWCLLRNGYWLSEFISISSIIKQAPSQYAKAFLYTETDDNDITYFILHQLGVIVKAFDGFKAYLEKQVCEVKQAEALLHAGNELYRNLNHRQVVLIKNALKHPSQHCTIQAHRSAHNITYETARSDLLALDQLGLFRKYKWGRAFVFSAVSDLKEKLQA